MIVGEANVGKTTLIKALASEWTVLDESSVLNSKDLESNMSTDGIDIGKWSFPLVRTHPRLHVCCVVV